MDLGLGEDAEESLIDFMNRVPVNYDSSSSIIPDGLKKYHVLDTWYTACFTKSFYSRQNPFNHLEFRDNLGIHIDEWLKSKSKKDLKLYLVCTLMSFMTTPVGKLCQI